MSGDFDAPGGQGPAHYDDRLDPTTMFGAASGRLPTTAEVVAQTILQMIADGKRAAATKQMERDAPVLDKHVPGEGTGTDVGSIVELARQTELIPDAFAVPMAQLLRGAYAPEAKQDLVTALRNQPERAKALLDAFGQSAPNLAKVFRTLVADVVSPPARALTGPHAQADGRNWILIAVVVLLAAVIGIGAAYFAARL